MRELTVRIRFTKHSLGNVKAKDGTGRFLMPRSPGGQVAFLAAWHKANLFMAAQLLGRHQTEVRRIFWDMHVDGVLLPNSYYRRYYVNVHGRQRYCAHECFWPGQVIGINCVVPSVIVDDDFWRLMQTAGRYRGLSPWKPGEFGLFEVVTLRPRLAPEAEQAQESAGAETGVETEGA